MGCLAINEHAKTRTGPRSGKGYIHTNTYGHAHALLLLAAECGSWGPGWGEKERGSKLFIPVGDNNDLILSLFWLFE